MDNMMNLEVLFVSANLTGNNTLRDIATSHADKTMVNHLRPDGTRCIKRERVLLIFCIRFFVSSGRLQCDDRRSDQARYCPGLLGQQVRHSPPPTISDICVDDSLPAHGLVAILGGCTGSRTVRITIYPY